MLLTCLVGGWPTDDHWAWTIRRTCGCARRSLPNTPHHFPKTV